MLKIALPSRVTVHNLANQAQELSYHTVVNTDQVEMDYTSNASATGPKGDKTVLVPPMGSVTIPIKINTSAYTKNCPNK